MKAEIRKAILAKRYLLSPEEIIRKSSQIKKRLFEVTEFKTSNCIAFYISFRNEVRTHEMVKEALGLGKKIIVPVVEREKTLSLCEIKDFEEELGIGKFGLLEPKSEYRRQVDLSELELVIVPGIAFDENGNRIGYGGGYYDNLLSQLAGIPFIGLAYELQIIAQIPTADYDIPVHKIITESRIITCEH
ncbi:MAG: 5-formyltetrahydrofolate cyclo-ligase [Nitrospirota bacterium]